jgi:hypothetical protein
MDDRKRNFQHRKNVTRHPYQSKNFFLTLPTFGTPTQQFVIKVMKADTCIHRRVTSHFCRVV